jgi:uncharacterized protein
MGIARGDMPTAPPPPDPMTSTHRTAAMYSQLPLFPLGTVLFPGMPLPLHVFEDRYRRLLDDHGDDELPFGVSLIRGARTDESDWDAHAVGTAARITKRRRRPDGRWDLIAEGDRRYRVVAVDHSRTYTVATIDWLDEPVGDEVEAASLLRIVTAQFQRYASGITRLTRRRFTGVELSEDPVRASYDLTSRLPLHTWERQRLLEAETAVDRLTELSLIVERELALLIHSGVAGLAINHPGGSFTLN